jgi:hypothetical protein
MKIDRIQMVVPDREAAAGRWRRLLDAQVVREDEVLVLGARRSVLGVGTSEVELLEPAGAGPVSDFAKARGGAGLFAAGCAVDEPARVRAELESGGIAFGEHGGQLFLAPEATGGAGLRLVVSPSAEHERIGLVQRLYEVTNLVADVEHATVELARLFALDRAPFVPIRSEQFGYDGVLTLFAPGELDRIEIIHPFDRRNKTMGRFHAKWGDSLYMGYVESDRSDEIRRRALEHGPGDWTGPREGERPDNLFLHPRALGGVMLGVSRTTFAWTWSGAPERVAP